MKPGTSRTSPAAYPTARPVWRWGSGNVPTRVDRAVKRTLPEVTRPAPTLTFAWRSKCRGILVRYEVKDTNYIGLIQLAFALCWYRRPERLHPSNSKHTYT
jgi:hypothetical protein